MRTLFVLFITDLNDSRQFFSHRLLPQGRIDLREHDFLLPSTQLPPGNLSPQAGKLMQRTLPENQGEPPNHRAARVSEEIL